jgi:hypothetical protein
MGFCALWIENWSGKFLVAPQVTLPFDKKARVISELHRSRRANFTGLHYGRNTPEKNYLTDSRYLPRSGGNAACWPPLRLIQNHPTARRIRRAW